MSTILDTIADAARKRTARSKQIIPAEEMIRQLYEYYLAYPERMPDEYQYFMTELSQPLERTVCDYIAGMSDHYAIKKPEG